MNRVSAKAAGALATAVAVAGLGWWVVDQHLLFGVRTDGPIPGFDGATGEVGGSIHGEMFDWADVRLTNPSDDPAVITGVKLLPGYGSDNLMKTDGFFILGPERSFGGGMEDAPSDASWWGVEPVPAIGHEVAPAGDDPSGKGDVLMIRLGIGDEDDASFLGIEVYYTWRGDEYKAYFNQAMLICDHDRGESHGFVGICRGEHPPPPLPD